MDPREVLYTTRAMRRMKPDPIPDDVLARIVDAGVRAPAPGVEQAWRFVVVTDRDVMRQLATLWQAKLDATAEAMPNLWPNDKQRKSSMYLRDHFADVPAVVFGYGPEGFGATLVLPALWTMCLAARAEGVGSVLTMLLAQSAAEVDAILGVPADTGLSLVAVVPMGYPKGRWGIAPRQPGHEVAFANQWGQAPTWRAEPPALS